MVLQAIAMSLLEVGVPLFIMLTGYLNLNKTISRKYYSGIFRVLIAYLFFAILSLIHMRYYLGYDLGLSEAVGKILSFDAIPYGWYVEMWIGLFLLIPFLNILYKGLESKNHKRLLIASLAFLTFLPKVTNRFGLHLFPDYWMECFPLTYFYLGAYIREYAPRINKIMAVGWILAIGLISPVFTMMVKPGNDMIFILGDTFGLFGAVSAVLVFLVLYDMECRVGWVCKAVYWLSLLSLDIYLCCWIFDSIIYTWFIGRYYVDQSSFGLFFFIIVPAVLFGSFALALVKRLLFSLTPLRKYS